MNLTIGKGLFLTKNVLVYTKNCIKYMTCIVFTFIEAFGVKDHMFIRDESVYDLMMKRMMKDTKVSW